MEERADYAVNERVAVEPDELAADKLDAGQDEAKPCAGLSTAENGCRPEPATKGGRGGGDAVRFSADVPNRVMRKIKVLMVETGIDEAFSRNAERQAAMLEVMVACAELAVMAAKDEIGELDYDSLVKWLDA